MQINHMSDKSVLQDAKSVLQDALTYAIRGWYVIPVAFRSKVPYDPIIKKNMAEWQKKVSTDPVQIEKWFSGELLNVGVQLGPISGVIDVEHDTPEGKQICEMLLGECMTPTFTSHKSTHRLFMVDDRLPKINKITTLVDADLKPCLSGKPAVEFRLGCGGKGMQSVFPPSVHPSAARYKWVHGLSPTDVTPIPLPQSMLDHLLTFHALKSGDGIGGTASNEPATPAQVKLYQSDPATVTEGRRNDTLASLVGKLALGMRTESLHDVDTLAMQLNLLKSIAKSYTPPLDDREVEQVFRSIITTEQRRRAAGEFDWRIVIVRTDPPIYEIHSASFVDGKIVVNALDIVRPSRLREQALLQGERILPLDFEKQWKAKLSEKLINDAERIDGDPTLSRQRIILSVVAEYVARGICRDVTDDDGVVDCCCRSGVLPDGTFIFGFKDLLFLVTERLKGTTSRDLCAALKVLGVTPNPPMTKLADGSTRRFRRLTLEGRQLLADLTDF
ncbi:MAG: bifunctional DNA primase/polymerase [Proteobacteria bacterium]|nr:bifunctional DNA primase/polymerase [Pseudomonadota bacterium]